MPQKTEKTRLGDWDDLLPNHNKINCLTKTLYLRLMKWIKNITAVFLVATVLAFSGGLNISIHLCKGEIVSKALNGNAEKCKGASTFAGPLSSGLSFSKKSCCDSESGFYKTFSFEKTAVAKANFQAAIVFTTPVTIQKPIAAQVLITRIKGPPLPSVKLHKVLEQYLI